MSKRQLLSAFQSLPAAAQRQVIDLVNSLKQEFPNGNSTIAAKGTEISSDPFIGMWTDRQDLADSIAWVRTVRRNEW